MKSLIFLTFTLFVANVISTESTPPTVLQERGVYVLDDGNYKEFIESNFAVFLEFYARNFYSYLAWCGHCQGFAPDYEELAAAIHSSDLQVKIAKVNAEENSAAAEEYEVAGYPTLKFTMGGVKFDYKGPRRVEDITNYIKKRVASDFSNEIESLDVATSLASNKVIIFAVFNSHSKELFKKYTTVARLFDNIEFYHSENLEILAKFGLDDRVHLMVQTDGVQKQFFGEAEMESFRSFINANKNPIVSEITEENAEELMPFDVPRDALLVLCPKAMTPSLHSTLQDAGKSSSFSGVQIIYSTKEKEIFEQLAGNLGFKVEDKVVIALVKIENDEVFKYLFTEEITTENLISFVQSYKSGNVQRHLRSEKIVENQEGPVETWVGANFLSNLHATDNDVFAFFYAPWCDFCSQMMPTYEGLAKKLKDVGTKIKLVKINAIENDVAGFPVSGFPTLFFIANDDKSKKFSYDDNTRTEVSLSEFIHKHASVKWNQIEVDMAAHKRVLREMADQEDNNDGVPKELLGDHHGHEGHDHGEL